MNLSPKNKGVLPSLSGLDISQNNLIYNYGSPPARLSAFFSDGCCVDVFVNDGTFIAEIGWIRFDSIWDSRCPEGALCYAPGSATVGISFSQNNNVTYFTLRSYNPLPKDISNYSIHLIDVIPYPVALQTISKYDYSIEIIVIKDTIN